MFRKSTKNPLFILRVGLLLGVASGVAKVLLFLQIDQYNSQEIGTLWINLFKISINEVTIYALLASLVYAGVWLVFKRIEGLTLAGVLTGVLFLPVIYFVNKEYLPAVKHPLSIIGNVIMLTALLACVGLLFWKWSRDIRFVQRLDSKAGLVGALTVLIAINVMYWQQPYHKRYQRLSTEPGEVLSLIDPEALPDTVTARNGHAKPRTKLWQFYSERCRNRVSRLRTEAAEHDSAKIVKIADNILDRTFTFVGVTHTLPRDIDWKSNPADDEVWIYSLNRQEWLWDLTMAYVLTEDPRYARAFDEIMQGWFEQNEVIYWKNESNPVWRLIDTGIRMSLSWIDAFSVFFLSDAVSEEVKWNMLASFHEQAQFLYHFRSPNRNHLLQETFGLMAVAGAFPEFKLSDQWLDMANMRLDKILTTEIYPDGGYNEASTFYHRFVIRIMQQIADFANEFDVHLDDIFFAKLEEMYTFLMYVAKPNGVMPQVNDGFHAKDLKILFEKPAEMFNRPDFEYFATAGESGTEPKQRSIGFPYSGLYVMRSDWTPRARYMLVDAGLFGSSHGHEDKLSFEISAFGQPFIVESGTYTYVYNRWHHYFESSFAHNTIVVDGRSQLRQPYPDRWWSEPPEKLPNTWVTTNGFDYLESSYDEGYGNRKEDILRGVEHQRRILFVKPDYWLLWDVVRGEGEHRLQQLFHYAPEIEVTIRDSTNVVAAYSPGPQLSMKIVRPVSATLTQFEGEEQPIQGWVSDRYGEKQKAAVIDVAVTDMLPQVFVATLIPGATEHHEIAEVEMLPVTHTGNQLSESEAVALRITTDEFTDIIMLAPSVAGEKQFGNESCRDELWIRREYQNGEIQTYHHASFEPYRFETATGY